jgi:DNA-binding NarL/FixJ family response regulator
MNDLTPTNRKIVELLAAGKTVKEIAATMEMKNRTIEKRIKTMRKDYNCLTVTQLVAVLLTNPDPNV